MKTNSIIAAITMLLLSPLGHKVQAQTDPTLTQQQAAIASLANLMVGNWEGSGWTKKGQAEPESVNVKESVALKNGGTTLLVQGKGTHPEIGNVVHDAMAIIHYDAPSNTYQFDSHLATGQHKVATGTLKDNVFIWGFDLDNNAQIKYTITLTGSTWKEIGEYSPAKDVWYKFFEMNLNKL
jgi:hypothetical protein